MRNGDGRNYQSWQIEYLRVVPSAWKIERYSSIKKKDIHGEK